MISIATALLSSSGEVKAVEIISEKFSGCRVFRNSVAIDLVAKEKSRNGVYFISFDRKAILFHTRAPYFAKPYDDILGISRADGEMIVSYSGGKRSSGMGVEFIVTGISEECYSSAIGFYHTWMIDKR